VFIFTGSAIWRRYHAITWRDEKLDEDGTAAQTNGESLSVSWDMKQHPSAKTMQTNCSQYRYFLEAEENATDEDA
jgi:hypothetical protein